MNNYQQQITVGGSFTAEIIQYKTQSSHTVGSPISGMQRAGRTTPFH